MPQNIAEFRIIGRIGKITAREKVTYVSVAANYNRRDGDDWKTDTLWNSVVCFSNVGPQVEAAGKGDLVHVTGRVRESNHGEGNEGFLPHRADCRHLLDPDQGRSRA
jgi:single-strand DNA-binding protein